MSSPDLVIDRRAFLSSLALSMLAAPLAAEAQQAGKVARVGILAAPSAALFRPASRHSVKVYASMDM